MEDDITLDLFGDPPASKLKQKSLAVKTKEYLKYRKSDNPLVCCRTCKNFRIKVYSRNYFKCLLLGLESYAATDIQASGVCDHWRKLEGP